MYVIYSALINHVKFPRRPLSASLLNHDSISLSLKTKGETRRIINALSVCLSTLYASLCSPYGARSNANLSFSRLGIVVNLLLRRINYYRSLPRNVHSRIPTRSTYPTYVGSAQFRPLEGWKRIDLVWRGTIQARRSSPLAAKPLSLSLSLGSKEDIYIYIYNRNARV